VFLVHGHAVALRESVARFIEKLGLSPIILQEEPNRGRTLVEKLEAQPDVSFAVVLMTPDDVGAKAPTPGQAPELLPRVRQNVMLELGYFIGVLGRENVCALTVGQLEIPSDYYGVAYISAETEEWQLRLAREMKAAQFEVDLNKAM
jgi:predicted nucleotide-binding protein